MNLIGFTDLQNVKSFLLAGKATLTIKSLQTGTHFTYKVKQSKDNNNIKFVSVLTGSDKYEYIGYISYGLFNYGVKSRIGKDAPSVKAFSFSFNRINLNQPHEMLEFYHNGHCGKCGRELTHPESIITGLGPICNSIN